MRDRSGRASGAGFRRSEGSDGSGDEASDLPGSAVQPAAPGTVVTASRRRRRLPLDRRRGRVRGPRGRARVLRGLRRSTPSSTGRGPTSPTSPSSSSPGRAGSPSSTRSRSTSRPFARVLDGPGARGTACRRAGPRGPRARLRDRAGQAVRHPGRGRLPRAGVRPRSSSSSSASSASGS